MLLFNVMYYLLLYSVHRDIKPENILLTSKSSDAQLKLADFGLSKLMKEDEHVMKTICG